MVDVPQHKYAEMRESDWNEPTSPLSDLRRGIHQSLFMETALICEIREVAASSRFGDYALIRLGKVTDVTMQEDAGAWYTPRNRPVLSAAFPDFGV